MTLLEKRSTTIIRISGYYQAGNQSVMHKEGFKRKKKKKKKMTLLEKGVSNN